MRILKDFLYIKQMPLFLCFFTYLIGLHLLFQNTFNVFYIVGVFAGIIVTLAVAIAQLLPHEYGSIWVKVSLSRKQLLDIRNQGHAVPGLNIVGHFRNSTEFFNFSYSPIDQYVDTYVKLPVFNYCFAKFDYGATCVFLWEPAVKKMILDALRLALRGEEPDYDNRVDIKLSPTSLELTKSYPIEVEFQKIPEDYYSWYQSCARIIFTLAAQIPIGSFADVWDAIKTTVHKWIKR